MEEKYFEDLRYFISYPEGFSEEGKYPLLIFLHGRGSRGETTEKILKNGILNTLQDQQKKRGYIFLVPHCKRGTWSEWMYLLIRLVDELRSKSFVDETRVYLTGNSMGGYGTWELAALRSPWFAAAMPICGGGLAGMAKAYKNLPIRTFHGLCDQIVDPIESLQMVKAVNNFGGTAELILFPKLPHNCWSTVYADEKNFDWLFSFTNQREEV